MNRTLIAVLATGLAMAAPAVYALAATAPAPADPADVAAAAAIAAEVRQNAGQMGGARAIAAHYADQIESHHYPAAPGDGLVPGGDMSAKVGGYLAAYLKIVPDYRMEEQATQSGNIVTVTSYISGSYPTGGKFEDVSMAAYTVQGGKVVRGDAIHTNPGAEQKAFQGKGERSALDHAAAEKIAAEMRATNGDGLLATRPYLAERVGAWTPASMDLAGVYTGDRLRAGYAREMGAIRKALSHPVTQETIKVEGNGIVLDTKTSGELASGEATFTDSHVVFYVTDGMIVGVRSAHSPAALANFAKIFKAAAG